MPEPLLLCAEVEQDEQLVSPTLPFESQHSCGFFHGIYGGGAAFPALHGCPALPESDQAAVKIKEGGSPCIAFYFPGQHRTTEDILRLGIGHFALPVEGRKLLPSSFPQRLYQVFVAMAGKIKERVFFAIFFSHEQERHMRRQQH